MIGSHFEPELAHFRPARSVTVILISFKASPSNRLSFHPISPISRPPTPVLTGNDSYPVQLHNVHDQVRESVEPVTAGAVQMLWPAKRMLLNLLDRAVQFCHKALRGQRAPFRIPGSCLARLINRIN
jgi:hypothetical protein